MTYSFRASLLSALILAAFVLPGFAVAAEICYPDGCVTPNYAGITQQNQENLYGHQATLAEFLELIFQITTNSGHALTNVVRDATNRIVFLACFNAATFTAHYNECPQGTVKQGDQCVANSVTSSSSSSEVTCPIGFVQRGPTCIFSECPQGYAYKNGQCVYSNLCTTPPRCNGNSLVNSCTGAWLQACDWGCTSGVCNPVPAPSATLKAIPSLVHSGDITTISWTGTNVTSCTVHGTNGDSWSGTSSSGKTSSTILGQTIYTLHCIGYQYAYPPTVDKQAIVNIIPTFQEQ